MLLYQSPLSSGNVPDMHDPLPTHCSKHFIRSRDGIRGDRLVIVDREGDSR